MHLDVMRQDIGFKIAREVTKYPSTVYSFWVSGSSPSPGTTVTTVPLTTPFTYEPMESPYRV